MSGNHASFANSSFHGVAKFRQSSKVKLPLWSLKECSDIAKEELKVTGKKTDYRLVNKQVRCAKQFFNNHNLSVVPSDKTKN